MFLATQYYRPPFPPKRCWTDDLSAIRDAGLSTVQLWCIWGWIQSEPGVFNYDDYDELVTLADKRGLKRKDWVRLFDFVWHCTTYNVEVAERDLVRLLRLNGFEEDHARDVAYIFAEGRRILLRKWRGDEALEEGGD